MKTAGPMMGQGGLPHGNPICLRSAPPETEAWHGKAPRELSCESGFSSLEARAALLVAVQMQFLTFASLFPPWMSQQKKIFPQSHYNPFEANGTQLLSCSTLLWLLVLLKMSPILLLLFAAFSSLIIAVLYCFLSGVQPFHICKEIVFIFKDWDGILAVIIKMFLSKNRIKLKEEPTRKESSF